MAYYRKKPVLVEAWRIEVGATPPEWVIAASKTVAPMKGGSYLVDTPEGTLRANVGDYLIKGVIGEIYPCKADIFLLTYEPVTGVYPYDSWRTKAQEREEKLVAALDAAWELLKGWRRGAVAMTDREARRLYREATGKDA